MNEVLQFLQTNWQWVLVGFYVIEKIVKTTDTEYDDIIVDVLFKALKRLTGKKGKKEK